MRAGFARLERFDFQSTSDQQDVLKYLPIAVGAPIQMLPEQAGNWAYAQPSMTDEEIAFAMVTVLTGRLYMSGFVDGVSAAQLELVADGPELQEHSVPHRCQRPALADRATRLECLHPSRCCCAVRRRQSCTSGNTAKATCH